MELRPGHAVLKNTRRVMCVSCTGAFVISGLYFDSIQNDIGAERAFLEANRFNVATPPSVALEETATIAAELEGFVPESGADDPSGEGAHGTGTTETPRLPEVYGRCS